MSVKTLGESTSTGLPASKTSEWRSMICWLGFILIFFALQALLWVSAISMARKYPVRPAPALVQPTDQPEAAKPEAAKREAGQVEVGNPVRPKSKGEPN